MTMDHLAKLKQASQHWPPLGQPCNKPEPLPQVDIDQARNTRRYFLQHSTNLSPVVIVASPFVPRQLVQHLMRNKRDSAIARKWIPGSSITNMEGMLHTFVTAFTTIDIVGDYAFRGRHDIVLLTDDDKHTLMTRKCLLSTQIQPDFEDEQVAFQLCQLHDQQIVGEPLDEHADVPDAQAKQNDQIRTHWDNRLRGHMIYYLTSNKRLPTTSEVKNRWSMERASNTLRQHASTRSPLSTDTLDKIAIEASQHLLSLEVLVNMYICFIVNELSALEGVCNHNGYIYTFDPPSIFAQTVSPTLLNSLFVYALSRITSSNELKNMRAFVFNDYADPAMTSLIRSVMQRHSHVSILNRTQLFSPSNDGHLDDTNELVKQGASLVIHNNSDAFGQNIETEQCTSLDGAIGVFSSAAACLRRTRNDLLQYVM
ncbi:hypothetical protein OIO90_001937 [Microbotryomycetes sp. JL221]|nr:hypothetical protein OIO90_001937 [Microbotryomycetes sp. JL221]